jgi:hypothetical protein
MLVVVEVTGVGARGRGCQSHLVGARAQMWHTATSARRWTRPRDPMRSYHDHVTRAHTLCSNATLKSSAIMALFHSTSNALV